MSPASASEAASPPVTAGQALGVEVAHDGREPFPFARQRGEHQQVEVESVEAEARCDPVHRLDRGRRGQVEHRPVHPAGTCLLSEQAEEGRSLAGRR